eukprot:scaffold223661_cov33-Tisochrysis_lutea.AAC.2
MQPHAQLGGAVLARQAERSPAACAPTLDSARQHEGLGRTSQQGGGFSGVGRAEPADRWKHRRSKLPSPSSALNYSPFDPFCHPVTSAA